MGAEQDRLDRLRLFRTEGVGPGNFRVLLQRHGSAAAALAALPGAAARLGRSIRVPSADDARRETDAVAKLGGRFLFAGEPDYPELLAQIARPPPVLAVLGDPARLQGRTVAIVGARNASAAGRRIAEALAEGLAAAQVVVASGLARGIDAAAHAATLRAGGVTVAAIAGGLDRPYPPEHAALQARIAETGVVLAEAPLGTAPVAKHFPQRNRIVAGLALGVVVVEAALKSGTSITANAALDEGRELFAVPGSPLDPRCRGSNDLLRNGAHLTETAADILDHLPAAPRPVRDVHTISRAPARLAQPVAAAPEAVGDAAQVLELLGPTPVAVDELLRRCHLSASALQAILLDLELAGHLETLPGNRVSLVGLRGG